MHTTKTGCYECYLKGVCLAKIFDGQEMNTIEKFVTHNHSYIKGERVDLRDRSRSVFAILKSGSARIELVSAAGGRQITSFHLAGDLIALNTADTGESELLSSVIFLEPSKLCLLVINSEHNQPNSFNQKLQQQLILRLTQQLMRHQQLLMAINSLTPEALVAMFLLDLSRRLHANGFDKQCFSLNMSREDIAIYLGLVSETVSRVFSKFVKAGLIDTKGKKIYLKDFDRLKQIMNTSKTEQKPLITERRHVRRHFMMVDMAKSA